MSEDQEARAHDQLVESLQKLKGSRDRNYVEVRQAVTIKKEHETKTLVKLSLRIYDAPSWLQVLALLLKEEIRVSKKKGSGYQLHICRQNMWDEEEDKLKFTWIFQVTAFDIEAAVADLCRLLDVIATTFVWTPPPEVAPPPQPAPVKLGPQPDHQLFDSGVEVVNGEVVKMPLLGKVGRNIPEGGLFEQGKGQKGAHEIKVSR